MDKWLSNKTVIRIAAFFFAVLLWAVVHLDEQNITPQGTADTDHYTRTISDVKITKIGLDEERYHIRSLEPAYVNIVLRGEESDIHKVSPKDQQSQIRLNLRGLLPGEHILPLKSIGFPEGVEVDIYPSTARVVLEEIKSKEVPVNILVKGKPAEGFKAGDPILNPKRVHVSVPSSQLESIVEVRASVDITGVNHAVQVEKKLTAVNAEGKPVQAVITPSVVDIEIPITSPFKTVPLQIQLLGEPPRGYSIASFRQSANEVTIYGSEDALETYDFYDKLQIDLSNLTNDKAYALEIPLDDHILQVVPERVEIEFDVVPSAIKTLEQFPITLSGQNEEVQTIITYPEEGKMDLVLEGAPSVLENVGPEDVQAIVDVSNLPPGQYSRLIKLNLPMFVRYAGDTGLRASVEIKPMDTGNEEPVEPEDAKLQEGET